MPLPRLASKRLDVALALLLALVSFRVYQQTRYGPFLDPKYALLTSEALYERGSWDLAPYLPGMAEGPEAPGAPRRWPYQIVPQDGRLLYLYPPGTPLLSVAAVPLLRLAGHSSLGDDGRHSTSDEMAAQRLLASAVTALTVVLVFAFARRELPPGPALVIALAAAFGSTLWTTAARALWTHTWSVALAAAALLEAQRWEAGKRPRPVWLAALLVALFWVRPTNAVAAIGFTVYVAVRHRDRLLRLVAAGALGLAGYVAWSLATWGALGPSYLENAGGLGRTRRLLGNLLRDTISVDRGLLVSSPILIALLWGLVRHRVPRDRRALAALAGGVALGIWSIYLTGPYVVAGTPGPRFLTDALPYLAALGALVWRARREAEERRALAGWRRAVATALLALGVVAGAAAQWVWTGNTVRSVRRHSTAERRAYRFPTAAYVVDNWSWRHLPQAVFLRRLSADD